MWSTQRATALFRKLKDKSGEAGVLLVTADMNFAKAAAVEHVQTDANDIFFLHLAFAIVCSFWTQITETSCFALFVSNGHGNQGSEIRDCWLARARSLPSVENLRVLGPLTFKTDIPIPIPTLRAVIPCSCIGM